MCWGPSWGSEVKWWSDEEHVEGKFSSSAPDHITFGEQLPAPLWKRSWQCQPNGRWVKPGQCQHPAGWGTDEKVWIGQLALSTHSSTSSVPLHLRIGGSQLNAVFFKLILTSTHNKKTHFTWWPSMYTALYKWKTVSKTTCLLLGCPLYFST